MKEQRLQMTDIDQVLILNCQERIISLKRALLNIHPNDTIQREELENKLSNQERCLQERLNGV